jgi:hypothetical protein
MATKKKFKLAIVWHQVRDDWRKEIEEYIQEEWDDNIEELADTDLEITAINSVTNEQVQLKVFKNYSDGTPAFGTVNGKVITRKAIPIKSIYDLAQYHMVLFAYDAEKSDLWDSLYDSRGMSKGKGSVTSWSFHNELSLDTEYTELEVNDRPFEGLKKAMTSAIHELMHALVKRCQRNGLNGVVDHMDKTIVKGKDVEYYKNSKPFTRDGNYQRTLASITENKGWDIFTKNIRTENVIEQYEKNQSPVTQPTPTPVVVEIENHPTKIFVHHTGGTDKNPLEDTSHHTAAIIKNWHVNGLKWRDIGYHWVIEKDGKRVAGRPETMSAAAAVGYNDTAIHIVLSGNFDLTLPTQAQTDELTQLLTEIVERYDAIDIDDIEPHRTVANKTCYGRRLSDDWARNLLKPVEVEVIPPVVVVERPLKDVETIVLVDELRYRIKNNLL